MLRVDHSVIVAKFLPVKVRRSRKSSLVAWFIIVTSILFSSSLGGRVTARCANTRGARVRNSPRAIRFFFFLFKVASLIVGKCIY